MKRSLWSLAFLALFGCYLSAAAPSITMGDSAELAAVGVTLGIGHSPGYPLYSILGRLSAAALPFGSGAFRMTLFSALTTAASAVLAGFLVAELSGSLFAGLLTGLMLGGSSLWLTQAITTEVFGLHSLTAVLLLYCCFRHQWLAACFIFGVGLGNNHTLVLLVPVLLVVFGPDLRAEPRLLLHGALAMAAGLTIYCFIPLRALRMPVMDWEEPATWLRFWKLVTRARYGTFQLAQGEIPTITWDALVVATGYWMRVLWEIAGAGLVGLIGLKAVRGTRNIRLAAGLIVAGLAAGPMFLVLTHVHPTDHSRVLLDRFLYLAAIPVVVLAGWGMGLLAQRVDSRYRFSSIGIYLGLACLIGWRLPEVLSRGERWDWTVRDCGRSILHATPPGSWLLVDRADESEFAIAYLQRVEGLRPDIQFVDCNAGVSRSIYGPGYYDIWGRQRLAIRTAKEREIVAQGGRSVYYATHEPDMIPILRRQEGLVYRATPSGESGRRLPWDQLAAIRGWRNRDGRLPAYDRAVHGDALQTLGADAWNRGDTAAARLLYGGAMAYAGHTPWREQMETFLKANGGHRERRPS